MSERHGETASERAVLDALLSAPPEGLTRADLQERTGLSPATLVALLRRPKTNGDGGVGRLVDLIEAVDHDDVRLTSYRLRAQAVYALGLDLGRHHVRAVVGDALGNVLTDHNTGYPIERVDSSFSLDEHPWRAFDVAADFAAEVVAEAQHRLGVDQQRFAGIGVSVSSAIEPDTGMFRPGWVADAWEGLRVKTELGERLQSRGLTCALHIDKDANYGALAYHRSREGRQRNNFVFIKWAEGLGAGIFLSGQLQRGAKGSAGAFGHSQIVEVADKNSREPPPHEVWKRTETVRCRRCGKQDCLEAMIGTQRLRRVVAHEKHDIDSANEADWPSFESISDTALSDRDSIEAIVLRAGAKRLGNALGVIANLLNPELIVIGGLFSRKHSDLLADRLRQGLRDVSTAPAFRDVDVQFTDLGIIDGTLAAVLSGRRLASLILSPRRTTGSGKPRGP